MESLVLGSLGLGSLRMGGLGLGSLGMGVLGMGGLGIGSLGMGSLGMGSLRLVTVVLGSLGLGGVGLGGLGPGSLGCVPGMDGDGEEQGWGEVGLWGRRWTNGAGRCGAATGGTAGVWGWATRGQGACYGAGVGGSRAGVCGAGLGAAGQAGVRGAGGHQPVRPRARLQGGSGGRWAAGTPRAVSARLPGVPRPQGRCPGQPKGCCGTRRCRLLGAGSPVAPGPEAASSLPAWGCGSPSFPPLLPSSSCAGEAASLLPG